MRKLFTVLTLTLLSATLLGQTHTFYKGGKGKLYTPADMDSIVAARSKQMSNMNIALQVMERQITNDTLFLLFKFNYTIINNAPPTLDSANLVNIEKLKTFLGKSLPAFEFKDINSKVVKSTDLKGRPIVINFWFTSCMPCIAEMPEMNRIQAEYTNTDVVFLSMTYEPLEKVKAFLKKKEFTYQPFADVKAYINQFTDLYPTTLFINRNGIVTDFMNGMTIVFAESNVQSQDHKIDATGFLKKLSAIVQGTSP